MQERVGCTGRGKACKESGEVGEEEGETAGKTRKETLEKEQNKKGD